MVMISFLLLSVGAATNPDMLSQPCQVPRNCGQHNNTVVCGHKFTGCEFVCGKGSDPGNIGCCHASIHTDQICNQCVEQLCKPVPPLPPSSCTGNSSGLNAVSCAAWQDLAKATNITGWSSCSGAFLDPCSCGGVTCADGDITELDLSTNNLKGTIPSSLAWLTQLTDLDLRYNDLTGLVPPLPFKQYSYGCWIDEPDDCALYGNCNRFKCPLPAGSEQCKSPVGAGVHCK
jgi:hypothetical protein